MNGDRMIEIIPGGPALVRGADAVRDARGVLHPTTRPVVAVCLCGHSQRPPWCDSTHKFANRARDADRPARED